MHLKFFVSFRIDKFSISIDRSANHTALRACVVRSSVFSLLVLYTTAGMSSFFDADLTKAEQEALAFVYDLRNKFESGEIPLEEPEEKGIFGAFKKAFQQ